MREVTFVIEKSIYQSKRIADVNKHVFISGLARSGTTILLRAIYASREFASLTYADMPFILAPNLWNVIAGRVGDSEERERAHGDGITVSAKSPEAFDEIYWITFGDSGSVKQYSDYVGLILKKYKRDRYLSKNNQNLDRLDIITKLFPDSRILIPFREPLQQANSLHSQHLRFSALQKKDNFIRDYMNWIGHNEFGLDYVPMSRTNIKYLDPGQLNHWLEQWYLVYENVFDDYSSKSNILFICYEMLCKNKNIWFSVKRFIDIDNDYNFDFIFRENTIRIDFDSDLYSKCLILYKRLQLLSV